MIVRHVKKKTKKQALHSGLVGLLSASCNFFFTSVSTCLFKPRSLSPAAVEEDKKFLCNGVELSEIRENSRKEEEHLYPMISPAQFISAVTPISRN